jgi:RNA 3'-terminal phosphate cyclase (ATP)
MMMIEIDGSQGEGGGQVLRTSLSLAALLGREMVIRNIRAGRKKPGLAAQHVTCCRAVAEVCSGQIEGAELGSQTVHLRPAAITGGEYEFDVAAVRPSAGSVCLVLQSILPVLALAPQVSTVVVSGGTDVPWSPPYAYLANTFRAVLSRYGVGLDLRRDRAGFFPVGRGRVEMHVEPVSELSPFSLVERGELRKAIVASTVADDLSEEIAGRQNRAAAALLDIAGLNAELEEYYLRSSSPGTSCVVSVFYERGYGGFTALGKRGRPAEDVGEEAARGALEFVASAGAVDSHLADQLVLYMALAAGRSELQTTQITEHLSTNIAVAEAITGARMTVGQNGYVVVEGIGFAVNDGSQ